CVQHYRRLVGGRARGRNFRLGDPQRCCGRLGSALLAFLPEARDAQLEGPVSTRARDRIAPRCDRRAPRRTRPTTTRRLKRARRDVQGEASWKRSCPCRRC
ncbi:unnamed protein product, partial [Ascophyllum nodosum]